MPLRIGLPKIYSANKQGRHENFEPQGKRLLAPPPPPILQIMITHGPEPPLSYAVGLPINIELFNLLNIKACIFHILIVIQNKQSRGGFRGGRAPPPPPKKIFAKHMLYHVN